MPISETSPLFSRPPATSAVHSESFPSISATLLRLGDHIDRVSFEDICPQNAVDVCGETAFRLVVLLELRARKLRQKPQSDVWNQWAEKAANENDMNQLNEQILNAWVLFLDDYRTTADIEQVLWTSFSVSDDSPRRVRGNGLFPVPCRLCLTGI
jgi:hypothetical protein